MGQSNKEQRLRGGAPSAPPGRRAELATTVGAGRGPGTACGAQDPALRRSLQRGACFISAHLWRHPRKTRKPRLITKSRLIPERNSGRGEMRGCPRQRCQTLPRGPPSGQPRPLPGRLCACAAARRSLAGHLLPPARQVCSVLIPCLTITTVLRQWFGHHLQ